MGQSGQQTPANLSTHFKETLPSILHFFTRFSGIPFAAPPVKELRLKRPEPAPAWSGLLDVSGVSSVLCPQFNYFKPGVLEGDEDCLYLNVYTPGKREVSPPV